MYGQWCTAVPINDVGVPNILYVAHKGWCPVCSSPTSLAALSNLLLNLLLLLLLSAFCFLLLYLCLLIIYTRLRESNLETLISWNSGKRWPAYYPLYPAEPSVGLASFDAWLNLSIINCVPGLSTISYCPRFALNSRSKAFSCQFQHYSIWAFNYSYILSSACATTSAPERLHNAGSKTSSSAAALADQKANFTSLSSPPRPSPTSLLRPQNKASMATVTETISLPNVGVYTDPDHKLWVAESGPTLESVKKGQDLQHGEVTIGIKSTGICGYTPCPSTLSTFRVLPAHSISYEQIRHPFLARRPHWPYGRNRHPHPRPRIRRRHPSHAPVSHAPQARRPCRHRTRHYL